MEKGNFIDLESGRSESDDVVGCLDNSSKCTENPFNTEREKARRKPSKPPRHPKSPSLLAVDQRLAQEISRHAVLKRARVERMKAFKNKKKDKSASSNVNFCALVVTIVFCTIIIWEDFDHPPLRETVSQHPLLITLPSWENLKAGFEAMRISLPIMWSSQKIVPTGSENSLHNCIPNKQSHKVRTIQGFEEPLPSPSPSWRTIKKLIARIIQDVCVFNDYEVYIVPPPPPWSLWNEKCALIQSFLGYQFLPHSRDGFYKYMVHWCGKFKKFGSLCDNKSIRDPTSQQNLQFKQFDPGGQRISSIIHQVVNFSKPGRMMEIQFEV